jgi:hypothetical protein
MIGTLVDLTRVAGIASYSEANPIERLVIASGRSNTGAVAALMRFEVAPTSCAWSPIGRSLLVGSPGPAGLCHLQRLRCDPDVS